MSWVNRILFPFVWTNFYGTYLSSVPFYIQCIFPEYTYDQSDISGCTWCCHVHDGLCDQWLRCHQYDDIFLSVYEIFCKWLAKKKHIERGFLGFKLKHLFTLAFTKSKSPWWRHQKGNIFRVIGPLWEDSTDHRWLSSARSFDVLFDLCLDKRLSEQSRRRWFETPSRSWWRHCNDHNWHCNNYQFKHKIWIIFQSCNPHK